MNISLASLRLLVIGLVLGQGPCLLGQATQRLYLSGHDKDTAVPWQFMCTSGAQSGYWTNLVVPSHWDLHGFGTLTYKKDATNAWDERGLYRHGFPVHEAWKGKRVFLVFEGVMTDTTAKLNGTLLGPTHQGGFYRFKYEVTESLRFGETNTLEVEVARHSANESVNKAERLADYWVFAGIYRPVYLEAVPQQFIERVAIDARHDGAFELQAFVNGNPGSNAMVEARITTSEGEQAGELFSVPLSDSRAVLRTRLASVNSWSAETPNLYTVEVRLKRGHDVIHRYRQPFGFRTVEVREGEGIYVNGERVILKGVNRHSCWPDSGRCLSEEVHRLDIETMKDMNMNAVRMSHYPPDTGFLDLCDELGLYVLDELAGWHNHYDDKVGARLVEAMVTRDVNHPSILFWDNGNEGGFNTNLDAVYVEFDPQQRRVLRPWAPFNGVNTGHYLAYSTARIAAAGEPMYYQPGPNDEVLNTNLPGGWIYMPTEFLHGLYDGGAGAGLEDYWSMMTRNPSLGGGFIWVFSDEGVKRPDTGEIDTAGNRAPDGIVGPYREREASFHTIKELWSPIQVTRNEDGSLRVENHYDFTDASDCTFLWQLKRAPFPPETGMDAGVLAEGVLSVTNLPPGGVTTVALASRALQPDADLFSLSVRDPTGRVLWTWTWPTEKLEGTRQLVNRSSGQASFGPDTAETVEMRFEDLSVSVSRETGLLQEVRRNGSAFSLRNGPRPAMDNFKLVTLTTNRVGGDVLVVGAYEGALREVTWRLRGDGWLQCDYTYTASGPQEFRGVTFDYPENLVQSKRWLGDGPYRVWKNRLRGVTLGVWETDYNDTITGYSDWIYPEFKGCFANVYWMQLATREGEVTMVPERDVYVQVLTPRQPPESLHGKTRFRLPESGIALLHAIPPVGSKFKEASTTGPQGQLSIGAGEYSGSVKYWFK